MRILYLHQYFVPPGGGGGTRSLEFARRLVALGHTVTLVTTDAFFPVHAKATRPVERRDIEGIDVRVICVPYANDFSNMRRVLAFIEFALWAIRAAASVPRPDVIFATSTPLTIAIPGIFAKLWHRRPLVFEVRDLWPEMPIAVGALRHPILIGVARALEWTAYRASDAIIALSPGMAHGVQVRGVAAERITVIPNAADLDLFGDRVASAARFFERYPDLIGTRIISYAGTFGYLNDIEYLIRVAAAAHRLDPRVRLVLCGEGQRAKPGRALAAELGLLESVVRFLPKAPKGEVADLFAASAVVCSVFLPIPEMAVNSANKFFDGLASGRAVFINYGGWQAELLVAHGAGVAEAGADPDRAGASLAALLADGQALERMGANARRLAERQFGRDLLFQRFLDVITAHAAVSRR